MLGVIAPIPQTAQYVIFQFLPRAPVNPASDPATGLPRIPVFAASGPGTFLSHFPDGACLAAR